MPGDGGVAGLARQRRLGVVAGAVLEVGDRDALDEDPVDADGGDDDLAGGLAPCGEELGRQRRRGGGREAVAVVVVVAGHVVTWWCWWWRGVGPADDGAVGLGGLQRRGEVVLEAVLGLGRADAGAPQLVGDEQQEQDAGGDHRPADRRPARGRTGDAGPRTVLPTGVLQRYRAGSPARQAPPPVASTGPMEPVVPSAPRSPSSVGSPSSPAPTSTVGARRGRAPAGPERRREDLPAAGLRRAARRWSRAPATVLGHDLTDAGQRRAAAPPGRACSGTPPPLYDDLTVAENVRFWGRAAGARTADVDAAMARLGLDGRLAEVPGARLSAGQRRRTSLACLRGPPARAVAARRAPRRARPGRARRRSTGCSRAAVGRRRHRAARQPRARPGRLGGHPDRRGGRRRRPRSECPPGSRAGPGDRPCGVTPPSSPARTCGSSCAAGSPPTRCCRSPSSCCCSSASPSTPTGRCSTGPRPACSGWRCCSRTLLAVQRAFAVEAADGNRDALRLSGLDPAGIVLGKVLGVAGQLLVLEAVLLVGVAVLYGTRIEGVALLVADLPGRHRRAGLGRVPLRRPRRRPAGPRHAPAPPAAARPGAGAASPPPGRSTTPSARLVSTGGHGSTFSVVFAVVYRRGPRPGAGPPRGGLAWPRRHHRHDRHGHRLRGHPHPRRGLDRCWSRPSRSTAWSSPSPPRRRRGRATPCASSTSTSRSAMIDVRPVHAHPASGSLHVAGQASVWWDTLAGAAAEVGVAPHRDVPGHRLALGPPDLGHLLGLGPPPHLHGADVPDATSATSPSGASRPTPTVRNRRAAIVGWPGSSTSRSSTSPSTGGAASTRAPPSAPSTRRSRASSSSPSSSGSSPSCVITAWLLIHRFRLAWLEDQAEDAPARRGHRRAPRRGGPASSVLARRYGIGYAFAGWAAVIGGGIAYVASVSSAAAASAKQVPDGRRRWSDPGMTDEHRPTIPARARASTTPPTPALDLAPRTAPDGPPVPARRRRPTRCVWVVLAVVVVGHRLRGLERPVGRHPLLPQRRRGRRPARRARHPAVPAPGPGGRRAGHRRRGRHLRGRLQRRRSCRSGSPRACPTCSRSAGRSSWRATSPRATEVAVPRRPRLREARRGLRGRHADRITEAEDGRQQGR